MVHERIMPFIWNIFHFLRIIPKPGSGCINKIALTMWLILIKTVGSFIYYFDFDFRRESYTLSQTIIFVLFDILIPLQSSLIIKQLASLTELHRDLKTSLYPKYPIFCLITTSMHLTAIPMRLYSEIQAYEEIHYSLMYQCYFGAAVVQLLLNFLLNTAARLVIGVAVNRLCKNIEDSFPIVGMENVQITIGPLILEYKRIKTKLSFLLLSLFTYDTILLTAFAYVIITYFAWGVIPYLFYIMLQLSYNAYVLDECYSTLKASLPTLRYSGILQYICCLES